MEHERGIVEQPDPDAGAAADVRAEADLAADRVYPHAIVWQWPKSFGDVDARSFGEWPARPNG